MTIETPQEQVEQQVANPELSFADIRVALEALKVAGERRSFTLEESAQVLKTAINFQEFVDFITKKEEEAKQQTNPVMDKVKEAVENYVSQGSENATTPQE